jgi:hypothetical protein
MCEPASTWPSRVRSLDDIRLGAVAFQPCQHLRLSRHRDPEPVGVGYTVQVESSLLHFRGIDELPKEGPFCLRPALVNNGGSFPKIRLFCSPVNNFRDVFQRRPPIDARMGSVDPAGRRELAHLKSWKRRRHAPKAGV